MLFFGFFWFFSFICLGFLGLFFVFGFFWGEGLQKRTKSIIEKLIAAVNYYHVEDSKCILIKAILLKQMNLTVTHIEMLQSPC
jgi:hypothetical protein